MTEPIHFVHPHLWERLKKELPEDVCRRAKVKFEEGVYKVPFLRDLYGVDPQKATFKVIKAPQVPSPELQVGVLEYLLGAKDLPLKGRWVLMKDLKGGGAFAASHPLPLEPILERYGQDPDGFGRKGVELGGERASFGDASLKFWALPRVPLLFVLWRGDEEFPPRLSVLFDPTAPEHMPLDALYGLAVEICHRLSS